MGDAPKVYAAISAVMAHMAKEGISKGRKNVQQGYAFRGIDDMYNALSSVMADKKLLVLPTVRKMEREERTTAKGGLLLYTILTVEFKFVSAEDGSSETVTMIGEAMDSGDKSANKAQSAALKYAAMQVFMIPTEGDNDADATTHQPAPKAHKNSPTTSGDAPKDFWGCLPQEAEPSAMAAKKDEAMTDLFKTIKDVIGELKVEDDFIQFIEMNAESVQKMPPSWRRHLREETETQAANSGVKIRM